MKRFLAFTLLLNIALQGASQWLPPVEVIPVGNTQQVRIDPNGNSVAIWVSTDSVGSNGLLQSGTIPPYGTSWNILTIFDPSPSPVVVQITGLSLDANANGDAVAIWIEDLSFVNRLGYSSLPFGASAWSTPIYLSPSPAYPNDNPDSPSMGTDGSGNAIVVWQATNNISGQTDIKSATVPFGSAVVPVPTILTTSLPQGFSPSVSVNTSGLGIAAWMGEDAGGTGSNIEVATYSGTWGPAIDLTPFTSGNFDTGPITTLNDAGDGAVLYYTPIVPGNANLGAFDYVLGTWTATTGLPNITYISIFGPDLQLGIDAAGDILAAWINQVGGTSFVPQTGTLSGSTVWGNIQNVISSGNVNFQTLAVTSTGLSANGLTDSGSGIFQASILPDPNASPWGMEVALGQPSGIGKIAGNAQGEFMAVWQQNINGRSALNSSFYAPLIIPPPANITAFRRFNQFLLQEEFSGYIYWTAPTGSPFTIKFYEIFSDSSLTQLVGIVKAIENPLTFQVHNLEKGPQTFYIVTVTTGGNSAPAAVTL